MSVHHHERELRGTRRLNRSTNPRAAVPGNPSSAPARGVGRARGALADDLHGRFPGSGTSGSGTSGTLPYVISQANANTNTDGSEIEFDPSVFTSSSPQTITLGATLALSETAGPEVIDGPGAGVVSISGGGAVGVFDVDSGVTATITGLTISGGIDDRSRRRPGQQRHDDADRLYRQRQLRRLRRRLVSAAAARSHSDCTVSGNSAGYGGGLANAARPR